MMKAEIEAVIFDLGRVLIDVDFTKGLFRYRKSVDGRNDQDLLEELFADQTFVDFNTGRITPEEAFRSLRDRYKLPVNYPTFVSEWSNIFLPIEGIPSLLSEVAAAYPVGLLSDIDPLHWEYCKKHFPFLKIFERPALSFEIGALKPALISYQGAPAAGPARRCDFLRVSNPSGRRQLCRCDNEQRACKRSGGRCRNRNSSALVRF